MDQPKPPVGRFLVALGRHAYRRSHVRFMFEKERLMALLRRCICGEMDAYESSDAVFGVKDALGVDLGTVGVEEKEAYGVEEGTRMIRYEFVLVSESEARELREMKAMEAVEAQGRRMKMWNDLHVPVVA
ncbi:hypothetical protein EJ05DRAFT_524333 [Pseudovirgaria hyperparasitica]|uniref:Uncharacterized protein n=1 Tax=Pseudovirgaria hyperparasitica TaxID=470096 RepID=A0A6A6WE26_9PEZI|nr:uncharacterized protein EJ05DRAFT_524333 [Pseudovirgaria hyperparasitica]KAF2761072.1 hypothetical protein EJ05DRAFT_524333 [Pseudovirgaria hyperparasitica]